MKGYYLITDSALSNAGNVSDVKNAIAAGVEVIQFRNKTHSAKELYQEAGKLRILCKETTFIINDRIDIALAVEADGVHIGQSDLPYSVVRKILGWKKIIGVTVHTLKQAIQYQKLGANYLGISPIFSTSTKPDAGKACGDGLIREIKKHCTVPLIAIGGINLNNARSVIEAGADGFCAISAVVTKDDVTKEILKFQEMFDNFKIHK